jgi:hypothetical protein
VRGYFNHSNAEHVVYLVQLLPTTRPKLKMLQNPKRLACMYVAVVSSAISNAGPFKKDEKKRQNAPGCHHYAGSPTLQQSPSAAHIGAKDKESYCHDDDPM